MELKESEYVNKFCAEYLKNERYTTWEEYCKIVLEHNYEGSDYEKLYIRYIEKIYEYKNFLKKNEINKEIDYRYDKF